MRINFAVCSSPTPIGGVLTQYHFANALAARGHEVFMHHVPFWSLQIESLDDLSWFEFHPGVVHRICGPDVIEPGDIVFGTEIKEVGLPVHLIQGREILLPEFERTAFLTPSLKIAIASWLVDAGERWGVPPDLCRVVHQGIDHDLFRVTRPVAERGPRVAMLHHTHPAKGWATGLAALRLAKEVVPGLRVTVFGTSAPDEPLPDWIELRLNPEREALVDEIYNRAAVFVQASDHEGFGLTAVEAMACGAALATTDNGGSRDYAFDGRTALVVPPRDPEALGRALVRLLVDEPERVRIADAGLAVARSFTWERAGEVMEAELLRYLADPEPYFSVVRRALEAGADGAGEPASGSSGIIER